MGSSIAPIIPPVQSAGDILNNGPTVPDLTQMNPNDLANWANQRGLSLATAQRLQQHQQQPQGPINPALIPPAAQSTGTSGIFSPGAPGMTPSQNAPIAPIDNTGWPMIDWNQFGKQMGQGLNLEEGAATGGAKAQQDYATAVQDPLATARQADQDYQTQLTNQKQQFDTSYAEGQQQYQNAIDDFNNTNIDPNHWYASRNTAGKINSVIAAVFSGLGTAGGGANTGMNLINHYISQDLDVQQQNIAKKGQVVGQQAQLLNFMQQRFQNDNMSTLAAHDAALAGVQTQLEAASAQLQGSIAGANAQNLLGQIKQQRAQLGVQVTQGLQQNAMMNLNMNALHGAAQTSTGANNDLIDAQIDANPMISPGTKTLLHAQHAQSTIGQLFQDDRQTILGTPIIGAVANDAIPFMGQAKERWASDETRYVQAIQRSFGGSRLSDEVLQQIHANVPKPGDTDTTLRTKETNMRALAGGQYNPAPAAGSQGSE